MACSRGAALAALRNIRKWNSSAPCSRAAAHTRTYWVKHSQQLSWQKRTHGGDLCVRARLRGRTPPCASAYDRSRKRYGALCCVVTAGGAMCVLWSCQLVWRTGAERLNTAEPSAAFSRSGCSSATCGSKVTTEYSGSWPSTNTCPPRGLMRMRSTSALMGATHRNFDWSAWMDLPGGGRGAGWGWGWEGRG